MSNDLTAVEQEILDEVNQSGVIVSVFQLAICNLGRDLSHTHACLHRLEERGYIRIERQRRGLPMIIQAVAHAD